MCLLLFTRAAEADDNGGLNSTIKWQAVIIELTVPACDWLPGIFNWTILQQSINQMGIAAAHQQISCFLVILICWASDDANTVCKVSAAPEICGAHYFRNTCQTILDKCNIKPQHHTSLSADHWSAFSSLFHLLHFVFATDTFLLLFVFI